ncbi:major facilitator superfamily domain-containing protein [Mycotypha africana]|uniref:major facilitator superfamily domain-containing protein n=1 Tax=Mycotypha africana TaxID=64632 RepID=UPI0023018E8E|nr:major facilitator superfamily domain-containing protein [Mycotypha africana]KAI8968014.1 major facilitator superfamily domain-containing protein [Mycotypha africana]
MTTASSSALTESNNNTNNNGSSSGTKISLWHRARRSRLGVACVVALTLFTDMLVYGVVIPCLPMLVIERLKGNSTMVGLLFGCYAFGLLAATPVFAILSDRYQNRRYPMLSGMIGLVISTLSFAMADTYTLLIMARVAQGVAGGASWTIGLGLLADVFPTKSLGVVMGSVLTAHTVGFAIGPAVGGFLFEYGGFAAPFLFCAGFAVINFIAILWLAEPEHKAEDVEHTQDHVSRAQESIPPSPTAAAEEEEEEAGKIHAYPFSDENTPLLHKANDNTSHTDSKKKTKTPVTMIGLLRNWRIMSCVLCTIVCSSVFAGIEPALPIHLTKTYDASASVIGLIFVAMVIPAFLAPVIGHLSDKFGRQFISATGMVMMGVSSPLVAVHFSAIYHIIPPLMLFGLSSPVTLTPILPEMGETVNEMGGAAYAQVYALYNMAYSIGMFVGPVIAGFIMSASNFKILMLIFGAANIICSPIMMDWGAVYRSIKSRIARAF